MSFQFSKNPEEELPDWLKELRKRQKEGAEPEEPPAEETPEEAQPPGEETAPESEERREPGWLLDIRERYQKERDELLADSPSTTPSPGDTQPQPASKEKAEPEPTQPQKTGEEESEKPSPKISPFPPDQEPLRPTELPDWLQALRPGGASQSSRKQEESSESERPSPVSDIHGALPAKPGALPAELRPALSGRIEITPSQSRHVAALRQMLAAEADAKTAEPSSASLPNRLLRLFVAAGLLLAILIPLLAASTSTAPPAAGSLPESAAAFEQIEILEPGSPVLVAFEAQPALIGEISAPAAAVLNHLTAREARLVFISTQPTGPALAEQLLATQTSIEEIVQLGYLSGGNAALRQFAANPRSLHPELWDRSGLRAIQDISDFALVLLITIDADEARAWIEQAAAYSGEGFLIATSAQAAPILVPYLESRPPALRGMVAGIKGADYYEILRGQPGLALAFRDAYSYGLGAVIALILLGGFYEQAAALLRQRSTARKGDADAV